MRVFSRRGSTLQIKMQRTEATILLALTDELIELVGPLCRTTTGERGGDPALDRLFPDAYPDDEEASRDFLRYTQADQATAKTEAASVVEADIADRDSGWVTVPPSHIEAWLVTLTNVRLVLATRLGIEQEADTDNLAYLLPGDPRRPLATVYEWCGLILESMLACLQAPPPWHD